MTVVMMVEIMVDVKVDLLVVMKVEMMDVLVFLKYVSVFLSEEGWELLSNMLEFVMVYKSDL